MTTETGPKGQLMWLGLMVLVAFSGLCTVFVSVGTAAQAWQEHAQARWPEVTGRVDRCGVDIYTHTPEAYWIDRRISYLVGAEGIVTEVHSRSTPAPRRVISQHPAMQIGLMQEWADAHPPGTPIVVYYDPADHTKVVLVATDMPLGGPRTPSNMKELEISAGSFLVLLTIARITRPRSLWQSGRSSMPLNP
jgi:hypothetical protein